MHDPRSTAKPIATPWGSFALVAGILMLTQLGFFFTAAALPLYLHDLGAAQTRIGFEVALGNVTVLLLTFAVGPAINRYGGKSFLLLAGIVYLIAALGMFLFRSEWAVAGFRLLQGVGSAALMPSAMTLAATLLPARPATALSFMGAVNNLALAFGPPLGLALYGQFGASGLFLPAIAAALLGTIVSYWTPRVVVERPAPGLGFDRVWFPFLTANALSVVYWGGIVAYLPIVLHAAHGPNAGIFFTADAIGVLLLRIPTGFLADRYGSLLPEVLGILITLGGIGALWLHPSIISLVLSGAGTGVGAGLMLTGIMADLSRHSTDANRGTAMAVGGASFNSGIFVGGTVSGFLIGPAGFNGVLLFGALTCLAALPVVVLRPSGVRHRFPEEKAEPETG